VRSSRKSRSLGDNRVGATSTASDVPREHIRTSYRQRVTSALSYAVLLGGILTIAVALYMVVVSYSSLPLMDGWSEVSLVRGANPLSPAHLWRQHNEHRLVIPKLFLAADLQLFQARQVFLLASILVIQFLHLALLSWSMRVLGGWRGALWRTGAGVTAFCLFCPSQWENFVWGFQVCFVLPPLFATLSFVALLLYGRESQQNPDKPMASKFLVVSIAAALGASYSLANGSLLWPLLVAAALYLRLRVAAVLSLAITGVVSTLLYLYHYAPPPRHAHPIASIGAPLHLLKYWAVYFVGSWTHRHSRAPELIALAGLAIVVMMLLRVRSYARVFRTFAIQLVLTMMFCAATALITAAGRLNLGTQQAFASRYQTIALLFWCCLGLLLLGSTFSHPRMRYSFLVTQVCLLVIFVRGAAIAQYPIGYARRLGFERNVAAAALLTNVNDPEQLKKVYPQLDRLLVMARYMKANQLSVFSGSVSSQLGKPLESVFPLAAFDACAGTVESVDVLVEGRGLRVVGWAWDRKHNQPPSEIVVTTNGIVTGLGAVGEFHHCARSMKPLVSSSYIGYVGYLPEPPPGSIVNFYAILHDSPPTACYFATK
jgi:hypothetical protein